MTKNKIDIENAKILLEEKRSIYRDIINEISEINEKIDRLNKKLVMNKTRINVIEIEIKLLNNYIVCDNCL